jgi:hypothetical protein
MLNDNPVLRWTLVALLVLLAVSLSAMVAMMTIGAVTKAGMMNGTMSIMGAMTGGTSAAMMSGGMMAVSFLWIVLVAVALVTLIVLLVRGATRA